MTVSKYLKQQLDIALAMMASEMEMLGIPKTDVAHGRGKLIPESAYRLNSVALIQNIMGIVLFDKNREALRAYYDVDLGQVESLETWAEFDSANVKAVRLKISNEMPSVMTPTLTTDYGDIILGVGAQTIMDIYSMLGATVSLRGVNNDEEDNTNVVKVDFTGPNKKH